MRQGLAIASAALLGACATATPKSPPVTPITLTQAQTAAIEQGLRKSLKDPDSARFGTIIAGTNEKGAINVCGYVNAKNSFGGYTGEKPFTGVMPQTGPFALVFMGGTAIETSTTLAFCSDIGLPLSR